MAYCFYVSLSSRSTFSAHQKTASDISESQVENDCLSNAWTNPSNFKLA